MRKLLALSIVSLGLLVAFGPVSSAQSPRPQPRENRGNQNTQESRAPERAQIAREEARERVERIREEVAERRAQVQQDVCERRQENLQNVIPRLSTSANTLLGTFDSVYQRVQSFYESGQLTVENYEELKANVDAAQADATASVNAIAEFEFELDCMNPGAGEQLSSLRQAVNEAKDELKDYRSELVALISALRAEAAESQSEDNGDDGDQDETNGENDEQEEDNEE